MNDNRRAFCMGNALVVGIPHRIGREIAAELRLRKATHSDNPSAIGMW